MKKIRNIFDGNPEIKHNAIHRMIQFPAAWIFIASVLLISAGTINWHSAWWFIALLVLVDLIGLLFIPLEVLAERGSKKGNAESWDKVLGKLIILSMIGIFLIAGLDFRWNWSSDLGSGLHLAAIIIFILGCALEIWAMRENRFFSDVVRIQSDREHTVCISGPYKFIRHPGYLGMIVYYLAAPILLDSWWAMIPALITMALFVIRTSLEDKTLLNALSGYKEYANRVRYRLIPGLW